MNNNVVSRLTYCTCADVQYQIWCMMIHCVCITVVFIIYRVVFTISPQVHNELWTEELENYSIEPGLAGFFVHLVDLHRGGVAVGVRDSGSLVWVRGGGGRLPGALSVGPDRLGSVASCSPGSGGVNGLERVSSSAVLLSKLGGHTGT